MPDYGMSANYSLTIVNVYAHVRRRSPGVYLLGETLNADRSMPVKYVGRDDIDLTDRLRRHAHAGHYGYFAFALRDTAYEAYSWECELFHQLGGAVGILDNLLHPAAPAGTIAKCPLRCGN
jgi:hypothetical protein